MWNFNRLKINIKISEKQELENETKRQNEKIEPKRQYLERKEVKKEYYYEQKSRDCLRNKKYQENMYNQQEQRHESEFLRKTKENLYRLKQNRNKIDLLYKSAKEELDKDEIMVREIEQKRIRDREQSEKIKEREQSERIRKMEDEKALRDLRIRTFEEEIKLKQEEKLKQDEKLKQEEKLKEEYRFGMSKKRKEELLEERKRITKVSELTEFLCRRQDEPNENRRNFFEFEKHPVHRINERSTRYDCDI